jgi:hypothetical protein
MEAHRCRAFYRRAARPFIAAGKTDDGAPITPRFAAAAKAALWKPGREKKAGSALFCHGAITFLGLR